MKIENGNTPTDTQLTSDELGHSFFYGFGVKAHLQSPIPDSEWPAEIKRMHDEEAEFWRGDFVDAKLVVELPFWLLTPNHTFSVSFDGCSMSVEVFGDYMEISHGPTVLTSKENVAFLGQRKLCEEIDLEAVVPNRMPLFREMRTTICFNVRVISDVFPAWRTRYEIPNEDRTASRRINRAIQYLQSLAFAHIPFLNRLITSYRSVSLDPWAFEVTECDVPVWFLVRGADLIRTGLMPYWDFTEYPTVNSDGESIPYSAATTEKLQSQIDSEVAAGKLELMDALSLQSRGRYEDAVRSIVTAIEVALEAQLRKVLLQKLNSTELVEAKLCETRNSFFERIAEYERQSKRRLPGPVLSLVPYINGIRFRREIEFARSLRHKVVHEGQRIDLRSRGSMLRVIETMTWVFEWLTTDDTFSPSNNQNYAFFNMLRGNRRYPVEFLANEVRVCPMPWQNAEATLPMRSELLQTQYESSAGVDHSDIELFTRMSLVGLGLDCEEGEPDDSTLAISQPRFFVDVEGEKLLVYCLRTDGKLHLNEVTNVAASVLQYSVQSGARVAAVCVVQHQQHLPLELRESNGVEKGVEDVLSGCGITVITTNNLRLLVKSMGRGHWTPSEVLRHILKPGLQGVHPPKCRKVGTFNRVYAASVAMSITLDADARIAIGDKVLVRGRDEYWLQTVESLQRQREPVQQASGPGAVGIASSLPDDFARPGGEVYVMVCDEAAASL